MNQVPRLSSIVKVDNGIIAYHATQSSRCVSIEIIIEINWNKCLMNVEKTHRLAIKSMTSTYVNHIVWLNRGENLYCATDCGTVFLPASVQVR